MPDAKLLTRGKQEGVSIATGVTVFLDGQQEAGNPKIWCGGDATLVVEVDMTGGAVGDLAVVVQPYEADNATVQLTPILPAMQPTTNPAFAGGHVYYTAQYDVQAFEMVRISVTNNNAGTQTITRASWRLQ